MIIDTKTCTKCKEEKPATLEYFYRQDTNKFSSWCKLCQCNYHKQKRIGKNSNPYNKYLQKNNLKICTQCKLELPASLEYFPYTKNTKSNLCAECINCRHEREKQHRNTPKGKYNQLISLSKKRNYEVNLTFEEFSQFWREPCFYCNEPNKTIGLDRINNNIGYQIDNVVACCMHCNAGKNSETQEFFFERVRRIAIKHNLLEKEI